MYCFRAQNYVSSENLVLLNNYCLISLLSDVVS